MFVFAGSGPDYLSDVKEECGDARLGQHHRATKRPSCDEASRRRHHLHWCAGKTSSQHCHLCCIDWSNHNLFVSPVYSAVGGTSIWGRCEEGTQQRLQQKDFLCLQQLQAASPIRCQLHPQVNKLQTRRWREETGRFLFGSFTTYRPSGSQQWNVHVLIFLLLVCCWICIWPSVAQCCEIQSFLWFVYDA